MGAPLRIALIAHDAPKTDMLEWARWNPLAKQAHASDVRSLIRLAVLHDVGIACNRRSADLMITSPLLRPAPADA